MALLEHISSIQAKKNSQKNFFRSEKICLLDIFSKKINNLHHISDFGLHFDPLTIIFRDQFLF